MSRHFNAFSMDVIARCVFCVNINHLGERDDPFMTKAQEVFSPPNYKTPIIFIPCNNFLIIFT